MKGFDSAAGLGLRVVLAGFNSLAAGTYAFGSFLRHRARVIYNGHSHNGEDDREDQSNNDRARSLQNDVIMGKVC